MVSEVQGSPSLNQHQNGPRKFICALIASRQCGRNLGVDSADTRDIGVPLLSDFGDDAGLHQDAADLS
jgi:hypothetical protein